MQTIKLGSSTELIPGKVNVGLYIHEGEAWLVDSGLDDDGAAAGAGARTANGGAMLLHQGVLAFAWWFDGREPVEEMRAGLAGGD